MLQYQIIQKQSDIKKIKYPILTSLTKEACVKSLKDFTGAIQDFNQSLSIYNDPGIMKLKKEAEIKLKENPPPPKYRAVQTSVHHIKLKKPVLTSN